MRNFLNYFIRNYSYLSEIQKKTCSTGNDIFLTNFSSDLAQKTTLAVQQLILLLPLLITSLFPLPFPLPLPLP